jgi:hypothetical protein
MVHHCLIPQPYVSQCDVREHTYLITALANAIVISFPLSLAWLLFLPCTIFFEPHDHRLSFLLLQGWAIALDTLCSFTTSLSLYNKHDNYTR